MVRQRTHDSGVPPTTKAAAVDTKYTATANAIKTLVEYIAKWEVPEGEEHLLVQERLSRCYLGES